MYVNMFRLIYVSSASWDLNDQQLVALLDQSVVNNRRDGITGALAYHDRSFFQVLEGSELAVIYLLKRIVMDERTYNVSVVHQGPVEDRLFQDWSMAWVPAEELQKTGFDLHIMRLRKTSDMILDSILDAFRHTVRLKPM